VACSFLRERWGEKYSRDPRVNLPNYSSLLYREVMIAIAEDAEALGYSPSWTSDHILVRTTGPRHTATCSSLSPR
jgi:hypothetical protein